MTAKRPTLDVCRPYNWQIRLELGHRRFQPETGSRCYGSYGDLFYDLKELLYFGGYKDALGHEFKSTYKRGTLATQVQVQTMPIRLTATTSRRVNSVRDGQAGALREDRESYPEASCLAVNRIGMVQTTHQPLVQTQSVYVALAR
jgi:hypothetical protein